MVVESTVRDERHPSLLERTSYYASTIYKYIQRGACSLGICQGVRRPRLAQGTNSIHPYITVGQTGIHPCEQSTYFCLDPQVLMTRVRPQHVKTLRRRRHACAIDLFGVSTPRLAAQGRANPRGASEKPPSALVRMQHCGRQNPARLLSCRRAMFQACEGGTHRAGHMQATREVQSNNEDGKLNELVRRNRATVWEPRPFGFRGIRARAQLLQVLNY